MLRIDGHQHFWQINRGDYVWLTPDLERLYRDYLPSDLSSIVQDSDVAKTILVQAAETVAETEFMLSLAAENEFISGVVGWVDMTIDDAVADIERLAQNPYFKGIRPMLQDIEDLDWILQAKFDDCFKALIKHGLTFDALVLPAHLHNLLILAERYPELSIVIDHGAKPQVPLGIHHPLNQSWAQQIRQLAKMKNVHCKLSGLLTEAGDTVNYESIRPFMQHLLDCFGPQKLMWGSDWPVINLVSDYHQWLNMTTTFLAALPESDQNAIWAKTTQSFYKL
ncbi:MAG: amidohydrolase family protein [Glaciecola sp.]